MTEQPPASIALKKLNIPHRVFVHKSPVTSFEQAASDRKQRPEQIVRSILFQIRPEEFWLVLMAGREQIDATELKEEISIYSGVRNMAIIMKSTDVQRALGNPEIVSLGEIPE